MVLTPYWSGAGQLTLWPTGHKAVQTRGATARLTNCNAINGLRINCDFWESF